MNITDTDDALLAGLENNPEFFKVTADTLEALLGLDQVEAAVITCKLDKWETLHDDGATMSRRKIAHRREDNGTHKGKYIVRVWGQADRHLVADDFPAYEITATEAGTYVANGPGVHNLEDKSITRVRKVCDLMAAEHVLYN